MFSPSGDSAGVLSGRIIAYALFYDDCSRTAGMIAGRQFNMRTAATHEPYSIGKISRPVPTLRTVARYLREDSGRQPGNPANAAEVLLELAKFDNPALHLLLGSDAFGIAERDSMAAALRQARILACRKRIMQSERKVLSIQGGKMQSVRQVLFDVMRQLERQRYSEISVRLKKRSSKTILRISNISSRFMNQSQWRWRIAILKRLVSLCTSIFIRRLAPGTPWEA